MSLDSLIPLIQTQRNREVENFSLSELIINEYELNELVIPNRLYFNELGYHYTFSEEPIITTDNVKLLKHDETGVLWSFETESLGIGIEGGRLTSASKETSFKDKYKIRHEFVAEALQKTSTDKKFREIFQEENDDDDEMTPDFIWVDYRGFRHVVELTTTRNDTEEGLKRAYDLKAFKYKYALEMRALRDITITYTIIVVSQNHVYSSIKLPRLLLSELIVRMRIGLALENLAKSQGMSLETDVYDVIHQAMVEELSRSISKIPLVISKRNELTIDKNYVDSIQKDPNEKRVISIYLKEVRNSKEEALLLKEQNMDNQNISKLLQDSLMEGERKNNLKSIVNLPLFLSTTTRSDVEIPDVLLSQIPNCLESKLWCIAMDNYRTERIRNISEDPSMLIKEALETDVDVIKEYESYRKSNRSKYHRVNIIQDLTTEEKERAAEQGLWAKRHKNDVFYLERRKQSQKPFSGDTYISDVDSFITNLSLLDPVSELPESFNMSLTLIEKAEELVGNSKLGTMALKDWASTKIFRALDLISDIGMELVISNKQNCKSGSAILKKLRYHDCYILIFPTKSSEHTFFTLYFPTGECLQDLPFRKPIKTRDGFIYPLVSVKQSKLENWCNASASLFSLVAFWSWFYELQGDSPGHFKGNIEATKMLLLTVLIRLEDKAETEETITQMRYMYMESFKGMVTPHMSNPFKMVSKLNLRPKSRLNLWCLKTCVANFEIMVKNPPVRLIQKDENLIEGEDALPKDSWNNLLNCFTGSQIQSASKVINLVYLGYLKNKNESPEGNTDFQLIEKTLEEEFKLDRTQIDCSKGETPDDIKPKSKQFNKNCIMYGCKVMEKRLERTLGLDWKNQLGLQILDNLASSMTETVASLKASCSIKHEECPNECSLSDPKVAMRIKVIEAVSDKLQKFGLNPFLHLNEFISYIETTSRGVIADLFKKQQHGGLREIYVLTIESRIIQLFIEVISRTICSYFDEETLTHPKNKLRKLNEHRRLSSRIANKRSSLSVDLCSSNDKTRWNQNFVMPAMIIPLIRLTPKYMHNPIIRIMNLWSNKLIRIPPSVCTHLINRTKFQSQTFNKMANLFWNPNDKLPIFDFMMSNCVRLQTGMMQGILHYTSSLLHLSFLNASNKIIPTLLKNWFPSNAFIMSQICSSDDSATMLSVFSPSNNLTLDHTFIKVSCISSLCLESLSNTCNYFCMQESVKTTNSLIDYVEFNSEFMFNNTIAMPVIKFVAASLNLTESESFLERFYTQYNLISDLFSSGFTAQHTHLCQISQALIHYKSMGSSTNAIFDVWTKEILSWPDPKYGFFLMDLDLMPGVMGFSYTHWNTCVKTPIFQGSIKELNSEPWVVTPDGGITQSLIIKHGEVLRWKKLVKRVVKSDNLHDDIDKDPSILFRPPNSLKELELKLSIQATSPGVAKSMRRGNPFIQSIAMSVYAINTHAFSKTTVIQDINKRIKKHEKVCLLGELIRIKSVSRELDRDMSDSLEMAFPNIRKYEEIQAIINQMRRCKLIDCHRFRERKNEVTIQPRSASLPLSLLQVVKGRWFGFFVKASHKIHKRCWDTYQSNIPWLRDTIQETLFESPFESYQELFGFINSTLERVRVFRRNGPGLHSRRFLGQIYNLIRKSQRPKSLLIEPEGKKKKLFLSSDMITKVNLALSIPIYHHRSKIVRKILIDSPKIFDDLASISSMTRREATVAYIQGVLKGDFTLSDVAIHMRDMGLGTHVSYVQEQIKQVSESGVRWVGEGKCYVFVEGCQVLLTIKDDTLMQIKVDNWKRLKSNMYNFNQLMREMKLKPITDSSHPRLVLAKYNGTNLVSPQCVGCPILNLEERSRIKFDPTGLAIRVELNEIKIVQKVMSSDKIRVLFEVCMLKYRMNHNDILLSHKMQISKDVWDSWINQNMCDQDVLFALMKRALRDKKSQLFKWLRDTLQSRLQFRNLGSFNVNYYDATVDYEEIPTSSVEDDQEEEEILSMIREGRMDVEETSVLFKVFKVDEMQRIESWADYAEEETLREEDLAIQTLFSIGMEDPLPIWVDYVKNWHELIGEESVSVIGPAYGSFLSVHPLWDEVINAFYSDSPTFWLNVSDGNVPIGFEEPAKDFMDLLEIKQKPLVARTLSTIERYKHAKEYIDVEESYETETETEATSSGAPSTRGDVIYDPIMDEHLESTTPINVQSKEDKDIESTHSTSEDDDEEVYSIFD